MSEKMTFTLSEIAGMIGVSVKTVRRRMEPVKEWLQKGQRKRFYNPDEVELIKNQFHNPLKGL